MTAQELFDQLSSIKEEYGTLDVRVQVFIQDADRLQIVDVDVFTHGRKGDIYSIDLTTN